MAVGGKIYVIGGAHANIPGKAMTEPLWVGVPQIVVGTVEEYDPATNTWRTRAPMPTGRNHFFAGVVDGKIYAINGRLGTSFVTMSDVTDLVEEYDPATDIWTYKGRSPTRRGDVAGAVYNGKLYVTGGEYEDPRGKVTFWAFEAYDPKTNSWQSLPHMQIARHGFIAGFIDNEFHVAAGSFQSDGMPGIFSQMATHEVFPVGKITGRQTMLLEVHPDRTPTAALRKPPLAAGGRLESWRMLLGRWDKPGWLTSRIGGGGLLRRCRFRPGRR